MREGDVLILLGQTVGELGASAYLRDVLGREDGAPPPVDLAGERRAGDFVRGMIEAGTLRVVHDLSDGGLIAAAAEMALASGVGVRLELAPNPSPLAQLFGEDQGRYLLAVADPGPVLDAARAAGVTAKVIGRAGGADLGVAELFDLPLNNLRAAHEGWLPAFMGE